MPRAKTADGSEGQSFEVHVLGQILPGGVGLAAGADARIADGGRADLPRRREVGLQQRR